jgi:hypothetical protein
MKRRLKIAIWISVGVVGLCFTIWILLYLRVASDFGAARDKGSEIPAHQLVESLNHLNPTIHVLAGFEASSYGGWHGDGGSVDIYLIDPSGIEQLIAGLKRYHDEQQYNYRWSESPRPDLNDLARLIPKKFLPKVDVFVIGRSQSGNHTISVGKTTGYVCFASSIF